MKPLLIQSIEYAIETGDLSKEQKRGIITLLPTRNKNRHLLKKLETNFITKHRL